MRKQVDIVFEGDKALVRFHLGSTGSHIRLLGNRLSGLRQALQEIDTASGVVASDGGYWEASIPIKGNPLSTALKLQEAVEAVFPGHEVGIEIAGLAKAA